MKKSERQLLANQRGFTLIEIIAVLVILGILAAVAVPKFIDLTEDAQDKALKGALAAGFSNVTLSYSKYVLQNGAAPTDIIGSGTSRFWTGSSTGGDVEIETDLGDYQAGYTLSGTDQIIITIKPDAGGSETSDVFDLP
ncbi:MAG: prepilin-type N-terminal cleavage/methylation domain-containing protein [Thermodesulfobacteriota bacterium]|nr:prepilin-type N-terminal cleavage/methylation domain-containing protein [Thermodesulfobacteriota bacterium]